MNEQMRAYQVEGRPPVTGRHDDNADIRPFASAAWPEGRPPDLEEMPPASAGASADESADADGRADSGAAGGMGVVVAAVISLCLFAAAVLLIWKAGA